MNVCLSQRCHGNWLMYALCPNGFSDLAQFVVVMASDPLLSAGLPVLLDVGDPDSRGVSGVV